MQIGETDLPLEAGILLIIFLLSIIFNIFLFIRGHQSYSIKYEIMLNDKNFRRHQFLTDFVEITYKSFFVLPFLLLIAIVVIQAFNKLVDIPILLVNGVILLLITYPFKTNFYYIKEIIIWIFAVASQFIALFLQSKDVNVDYYTLLCTIFYPINSILFCLALLSREDKYWQIEKALAFPSVQNKLKEIYPAFTVKEEAVTYIEQTKQLRENQYFEETATRQQIITKFVNIPQIFNGGIYGTLCRQKRGYKFTVLYVLSLCILAINAGIVWKMKNSSLGVIGLITNFIYDLFIFSFNVLPTPQRSIRNVFILVFFGRFMSFIFGEQLWIFGYCILYLFVGVFIGNILINDRLPLRNIRKKNTGKKYTNAFRTPQFVLFILTVQIFLLVLAKSLGIASSRDNVSYNDTVSVPLWQFSILVVIVTWIIILYLASMRMYQRHLNSIKNQVQYYFGSKAIKQHHIYIIITYLLIVGLGIYCNYALKNTTALIACIFLPIIWLALNKFVLEWINNEYSMFADIPEYNRKLQKLNRIIEKKQKALKKQKGKDNNQQNNTDKQLLVQTNQILIQGTSKIQQQNSKLQLVAKSQTNSDMLSNVEASQQLQRLQYQKKTLKPLQDWRQFEGSMNLFQFWKCLTPSDKWILIMVVTLTVLFISFILCDYIINNSIFGIFIVICLVSLLSLMPFYRYSSTFKQFVTLEYIWYEFGFVLGVIYWSAYNNQITYTMVWAAIYIIALTGMLAYGVVKKIQKSLIYWLIANLGLTICFICVFIGFKAPAIVAIIISAVLFMACVAAIPVAFLYIEGYLPTFIKAICGIIIGGGVIVLSVIGFVLGFASDFAVFTFVMFCIYIILMVIAGGIFYQKQAEKYQSPHVYSAFGEPIYKFDSAAQQLKSSKVHKVLFDIASALLIVYAAGVSLVFAQKQWAIYALGVYCCQTFFQNILFALKTYEQLGNHSSELTQELMLKTLQELDEKYMLDFKENKYSEQLEKIKDEKKKQAQMLSSQDQLDAKWLQIAKINSECIKNRQEQYKFLFFWIVMIEFHIFTKAKAKMVTFINQIKEIEEQLIQLGIFLTSLSYAIDFVTKYQLLNQQIQGLGPIDYLNLHQILKKHQKISMNTKQLQNKKGEDIDNQQKKKQIKIFENLQGQLNKSTNEKINQFNILIKSLGKKDLFEDHDFKHNQDSLGVLASIAQKWRRPTSKQVLIKGTISAYDVRQGNIGDCYLISSLGVLGEKWILPALGYQNEQKRKWVNQKGAYMVRFFKFSKELFVTVDDYLPVDDHDEYVFAKSEEQNEIWPCILEKAYAKLYGGYENIVEGQCHRVFAQLSGGVPFEVLTKDYESNPNGLWQKIINSKANNYLMAAGSNAHELGDQACSKRNIVYGHAYSILDVKQVEGYKLMKLKNPHGSGGKQWNGDFSDTSQYMNDRMMLLLGHQKKDDGVFWMKLDDFMHQFRSVYICAIFDEKMFKKFQIDGEFTEQNSYGTPSKSEQTFRNPQYGITINCKSTIFVNLTQKDTISTFQGKNFIFMRVQKTNGKRVSKFNKNEGVCGLPQKSKNTISVSTQVVLQADSYPCTFTLYVSCADEGDTGQYKLQIYCTDKSTELIPDKDFDREQF